MKHDDRFYVYCYAEPGADHPFYIGKGAGDRAYQHLYRCANKRLMTGFYKKLRKLSECGASPCIEYLGVALTEEESFSLERTLIAKWGRVDLGTGCLLNGTDGGEGMANPTAETRAKLSYGQSMRIRSLEQYAKASATLKARGIKPPGNPKKAVESYDLLTGLPIKIYQSASEAEKDGYKFSSISAVARGTRNMHRGLGWRFLGGNYKPPREDQKLGRPRESEIGVEAYDPGTGVTVKHYVSVNDTALDGYCVSHVMSVAQGQRHYHQGLGWRFLGEMYIPPRETRPCGRRKKVT